jgi:hypothetical protein
MITNQIVKLKHFTEKPQNIYKTTNSLLGSYNSNYNFSCLKYRHFENKIKFLFKVTATILSDTQGPF